MKKRCCAYCKKTLPDALPTTTSFCSSRCHTNDLGRWFNEEYTVPMVADELTSAILVAAELGEYEH